MEFFTRAFAGELSHAGNSSSVPALKMRQISGRNDTYYIQETKELGKGAKSTVYIGFNSSNVQVAIKEVHLPALTSKEKSMLKEEISILSMLPMHRNVVKFFDAIHQKDEQRVYLVFEKLHRSLFDLLEEQDKLSEPMTRDILSQIHCGLTFIHNHGVVHGDLKLENIMLNQDNVVKIIDFGFAVRTTEPLVRLAGSIHYISPELLSGKPFCGRSNDAWAFCVLAYTMMVGQLPFFVSDRQKAQMSARDAELELFDIIRDGLKPSLYHRMAHLSLNAADFLTNGLDADKDYRLSMSEIIHHPFFYELSSSRAFLLGSGSAPAS